MKVESTTDERVARATAVYDSSALNFYDLFVHGFCNRFAWECPTSTLVDQYNRSVTGNHLELGVGTGFLLDRCHFPVERPRLTLVDLSKRSLEEARQRLARYNPETRVWDILKPAPEPGEKYDSIGVNYVYHTVPGTFEEKGKSFEYVREQLAPDGELFGSTLLGTGVARNRIARGLMALYHRAGLFSNQEDSPQALDAALKRQFSKVEVEVVGCCALFSARI